MKIISFVSVLLLANFGYRQLDVDRIVRGGELIMKGLSAFNSQKAT
jgi:hypothetical protein